MPTTSVRRPISRCGRLGHETKRCDADQKRIRRASRREPERNLQSFALRIGEVSTQIEDRAAQLMKCGVRELHLPFDADRALDTEIGCGVDRILEQRRLSHARLPVRR
jgi:hypothetical protein